MSEGHFSDALNLNNGKLCASMQLLLRVSHILTRMCCRLVHGGKPRREQK